jgi:ADP-heptose:LPS heptosyltransferase
MAIKEKGNIYFHKMDRFIGIPVTWLLGVFKIRKNTLPKTIKEIAILSIVSIGDNVILSAAIQDIKKEHKDSIITIFTGSTNFSLVKMIPGIDKIVKLKAVNPFQTISMIKKLPRYDILIDISSWARIGAIYSTFFKAHYKIGFKTESQYRHYTYDKTIEHSPYIHELENYRLLISPFVKNANSFPRLDVEKSEKVDAKVKNKVYCIIHPWSAGLRKLDKQWKTENWVKLCNYIAKDFDQIIITGGPSDVDDSNDLLNQVKKSNEFIPIVSSAGQFSIQETSRLISLSSFVFCVDTGISHVAAALNKQLVCLQGPANSIRWRPYSDKAVVINPSSGFYGYISLGFEKSPDNTNCMENVSVKDVIEAYNKYTKTIFLKSCEKE